MKYNFPDHIKGDTFSGVQFTILVNDVPLNLTGAAIRMQIRENETSPPAIEFSLANTRLEIIDAAAGIFKVKEQVVDVPPKTYLYDIEITISGKVKTYVFGSWRILKEITYG